MISIPVFNQTEAFRLIVHGSTTYGAIKIYFTQNAFFNLAIQFQNYRSFLLCFIFPFAEVFPLLRLLFLFCPSFPCLIMRMTFALLPVLPLLSRLDLFPIRCPRAVLDPQGDWSWPKGGGIFAESVKSTRGGALSSLRPLIQTCLLGHAHETLDNSWVPCLQWVPLVPCAETCQCSLLLLLFIISAYCLSSLS